MADAVLQEAFDVSPTQYGVAKLAHSIFKGKYIFDVVDGSPTWYHADGFKVVDAGIILNGVSKEVLNAIHELREKVSQISPEVTALNDSTVSRMSEELEIDPMETKRVILDLHQKMAELHRENKKLRALDNLTKVFVSLQDDRFKSEVVDELARFFYVSLFSKSEPKTAS